MQRLVREFLSPQQHCDHHPVAGIPSNPRPTLSLPPEYLSPATIAREEPIVSLLLSGGMDGDIRIHHNDGTHTKVHTWYSPVDLAKTITTRELEETMELYASENYFIHSSCTSESLKEGKEKGVSGALTASVEIFVCLGRKGSVEDHAKAIYEALLLAILRHEWTQVDEQPIRALSTRSFRHLADATFPLFWRLLKENSWNTGILQLRPRGAMVYDII
jgi:hypothetical protein